MKTLTLDQLIFIERLTGRQHYMNGNPRSWPRTDKENIRYRIPKDHLIGKPLTKDVIEKMSRFDVWCGKRPPEYGIAITDYPGPNQKLKDLLSKMP
jgi:hypothetical protein